MVDKYNFNVVPNDEQEEFTVDFGETIKVVENDFNQLENRPSYAGTTMTGDTNIPEVPTAVSQLTNDADYQTGADVQSSISSHNESEEAHPYLQGLIGEKQDQLTAGTNISIDNNVISATDTRYSAGNGLNLSSENAFSVDTTVVATQQNLANEVTNRENADNALQAQIDGISASSDVVDIVGTYADLQNYDTQHLKDNDIIKVLQDETQGGATTYYRWSTTTDTFTLIGQEGPYYTKAAADSQFVPQTRTVNGKALSSNITLNASDVSALGTSDVVQTTGSSTSQVMSQNAVTTQLNTKLNASDYVVDTQLADSSNPVQNRVINNLLGDMPADFFTAGENVSGEGTDITLNNTISAPLESVELDGDTYQQTYSGYQLLEKDGIATASSDTDFWFSLSNMAHVSEENGWGKFTPSSGSKQMFIKRAGVSSLENSTEYTIIAELRDVTNHNGYITFAQYGANDDPFASGTIIQGQNQAGNNGISVRLDTFSTSSTTIVFKATTKSSATSLGLRTFTSSDLMATFGMRVTIIKGDHSSDWQNYTWEPYVGGTPSPNPDYPQDVQVVTGEQIVLVHGKNLMNIPNFDYTQSGIRGVCTNGVIEFTGTAGNTYYPDFRFCADGNVFTRAYRSTAASINVSRGFFTKPNTEYKLSIFVEGDTPYSITEGFETKVTNNLSLTGNQTFTINDSEKLNFVSISFSQNTTTNLKVRIQLEQGSIATAYEPYQGNNYPISLGSIELCKIGTYQDYIYKSGDDWYVHKAITKTILDGTEDWSAHNTYNGINGFYWLNAGAAHSNSAIIANSYRGVPITTYNSNNRTFGTIATFESGTTLTTYTIFATQPNASASSLAQFKTWLNSNNITTYYAAETPTDTKITDATLIGQLEALYNTKTYLGTTSIMTTATGTNLPVILDIAAYRKSLAGILGAIERLSE